MKFGFTDCLNVIGAAQIFLSKTHTLLVLFYLSCAQTNKQNSAKRIRITLFHVFLKLNGIFIENDSFAGKAQYC